MMTKQAGHQFLAKLGKKRLRPGGKEATDWLIKNGNFSKEKKVLEVGCNMCTTSIELVKTYQCHITGIDLDKNALEQAKQNIKTNQLEEYITVQQGNAMHLPFDDNSFDIIINEAMLTMLSKNAKVKAIKEYYRVLKPNGILLTHDITFFSDTLEKTIDTLRETIHVNVHPMHRDDWLHLFQEIGFESQEIHGQMSLMTPTGMIKDEGFLNTMNILKNGLLKSENRPMFLNMFKFFNKTKKDLMYIAICSRKKEKS
ncbi:class I SAM-dependent methyltransferase [Carnobacteriaceae bacterium zg-ZUI78]|nr:class I SAM-dependent methyltransferase [Carnobacteriaceae bacterium zg-ZUI78]